MATMTTVIMATMTMVIMTAMIMVLTMTITMLPKQPAGGMTTSERAGWLAAGAGIYGYPG
jgi:hypothetical protein